jgi:GNAT superfamily N-acetyltransferase
MDLRLATAADTHTLFDIRTSVRENHQSVRQLARIGVTPKSVAAMLDTTCRAWIGSADGLPVAFSMADAQNAMVFAMFVRLGFERRGFGRALMREAEDWLLAEGCAEAWLLTGDGPGTRAPGFYEHLGWSNVGKQGDGQFKYVKRLRTLAEAR